MMKKKIKKSGGFTLMEMLIAVAIFVLIATFALGSVISIFDANRKAQSSKTVVDNLNLSIENMARTVRYGTNYYCGASNDLTDPVEVNDCSSGDSAISVTFEGNRIIYRLCGTQIKRSENGDMNCNDDGMQTITSSDTIIDYLKFYVFNTNDSSKQPYAVVVMKGHVGNKPSVQTNFSIETMMSQRYVKLIP